MTHDEETLQLVGSCPGSCKTHMGGTNVPPRQEASPELILTHANLEKKKKQEEKEKKRHEKNKEMQEKKEQKQKTLGELPKTLFC